jgi:hypothetical protein
MTKNAMLNNFATSSIQQSGGTGNALPSHVMNGGLFLMVDKVFGEKRLVKKKLSDQESLKVLSKHFAKELKEIFGIIGNFREGIRSFEVFGRQPSEGGAPTKNKRLGSAVSLAQAAANA